MLLNFLIIWLTCFLSTLISVLTGYTLAKTWLDKKFNKPTPKTPVTL